MALVPIAALLAVLAVALHHRADLLAINDLAALMFALVLAMLVLSLLMLRMFSRAVLRMINLGRSRLGRDQRCGSE
jgi:hypothetical protein